jgi:hypothetical protein
MVTELVISFLVGAEEKSDLNNYCSHCFFSKVWQFCRLGKLSFCCIDEQRTNEHRYTTEDERVKESEVHGDSFQKK